MAKPDDLSRMLEQVQQMQADMMAAQQSLADETVEGSAGGGVVKAVVTGAGDLRSVSIDPEVVDPDEVELLEDLVVAAVNEATRRAHALQAERLGGITGGVDLGGMGGLLGG